MDDNTLRRISAIDELIFLLNEERSLLVSSGNRSSEHDEKLKAIAVAIVESGYNRESIQSDKWAGIIIMNATVGRRSFLMDDMQKAKHVLGQIVAAGHLKLQSEYSTRRGRSVPVYVLPQSSHL